MIRDILRSKATKEFQQIFDQIIKEKGQIFPALKFITKLL